MKNLYLLILLLSLKTIAQIPTIDNTFNTNDNGNYEQYIGKNSALLPDGKLLSVYNNSPNEKIIRLNQDGRIDNTFNYTDKTFVQKIYVKSDGKFLVTISNNNDVAGSTSIKSYNDNGTLNANFTIPKFDNINTSGSVDYVIINELIYQSDGKIIVVGDFTKVNNISCNNIVRLNSNGTIDTSFTIGIIFPKDYGDYLTAIALQSDGKYLVAGNFSIYNSITKTYTYRLIRINNDGTLDNTFSIYSTGGLSNTIDGFDWDISKIIVQPDNKIIVSQGNFRANGYIVSRNFTRLNSNGTRDISFKSTENNNDIGINVFCMQNDGKIIFPAYDKMKRLNSDGTKDNTFIDVNTNYTNYPSKVYMQNDKIIINSHYKSPSGLTRNGITRLNSDGSLDLTFNPQSGTNLLSTFPDRYYYNESNTKVLLDGKLLLFGCFTAYNDSPFNHICRLNQDGQFDSSFHLDPAISFTFNTNYQADYESIIKQQNDGKILFTNSPSITVLVNGVNKNLVRINENGSLDATFNFASGNNLIDYKIQNDGKIIAIGTGPLFTENTKFKVIRLNLNGSVDSSFTSMLFSENLISIEIQNDNKILVIHPTIWNYTTNTTISLQRLNQDGTLDTSFIPAKEYINYSKLQPDGKIIISYYNNTVTNKSTYLARLNTDGTKDVSFTENYGYGNSSYSSNESFSKIFITSQGKIIISPIKNYLNDVTINKKYVILSNSGIVENYFGDNDGLYNSISQQNCDYLIVSGYFDKIDGVKKNNMVRYSLSNSVTPLAPTGNLSQTFTSGQTISNLVVNGQNIQWYNTPNLCASNNTTNKIKNVNVVLPTNTLLVDGATYFATQTINGIESNYRLPITVTKTLGTNDYAFENLNIFPIPIQDFLTISNNSAIDSVEIYNLLGQILFNEKYNSNAVKIDFSSFNSGVYLAKVYSDNNIKSIKVVKK
ncbi:T9SS type A sorting domain-containing protein [Flavobacterium rhamnosiphilum]|uniref:T9SS type A sorting domain-containing protein n=1 Tax=Flavobacterium rhamnosiphilum TaxID=2541724 RepID=A0A4R5F982_9FLAO|nr:T9SS type A sorting domain-containing protein [Flavobacterium rhamnosiphilum]TDE45046.1 T9SS type A sorting domain-containing protein [Flavobacterium rhamnosiphilum]